jgi:hypothetical protein
MMYITSGVQEVMANNESFSKFVYNSLIRFRKKDWGTLDEQDRKMNDEAVQSGERILAAYELPSTKELSAQKIWIIMEYGHRETTILFPNEY